MGIFFRQNNDGFLSFDNILNEKFQRPANVTAHPIQNKAKTTDHRQQQQLRLSVTGLVTETPFEVFVGGNGFEISDTLPLDEGPTSVVFGGDPTGERSRAAIRFWELAEPEVLSYFSVRLGFVENLMITNISYEVTRAQHLVFEIECVQVEFSESQTVDLPPLAVRAARPEMCPRTDVGPRATVEANPAAARDISVTKFMEEMLTGKPGDASTQALNELVNTFAGSFP